MSIIDQNSGDPVNIWIGTQSEYDAITVKDEDTLYFIKENDDIIIVNPPEPEPEPEPEPSPEPELSPGVIDENVIVGTSLHFESTVNSSFDNNILFRDYTQPRHEPSFTFYSSPEGATPGTLLSVTDTHVIFSSTEETTLPDGSTGYGALYLYSFENIKKLRGLNIDFASTFELDSIANEYGIVKPLSDFGDRQKRVKALTYYILNPTKLVNGGYKTVLPVIEPELDLPDDQEHWSGSTPRYEWSEFVETPGANTSLLLTWNNSVVYSEIIPAGYPISTEVQGDDGRIYQRGSLQGTYGAEGQSNYYSIIRQGE